jgi:hypothetical protein
MKKQLLTLLLSVITGILFPWFASGQNTFPSSGSAGVGTTTPNTSSLLELRSTTKGLLISRMTKAQRDAIASPATGLMIFQTDNTPGFYYYSGTSWTAIGASTTLSNLKSPTALNVSLLPAANNAIDLGSSSLRYRSLYVSNLHFSDGSVQTTAFSRTAGGDLSGTYPNPSVVKLRGVAISSTAPTNGQVLKYNSTTAQWQPAADNTATYSAGTGISINGTTITNTAPDKTVSLTGSGAITISGSYPNFTISSTGNNTTYAAGNGISINGTSISLAKGTAAGQVYVTGLSPFTPTLQTISGDATINNTGALTLTNSGVTAGTYSKVTVDTKGRVKAGTTLASTDIPAGSINYIQNQSASDQPAAFRINGNGIFNGGNVGIGTISPAAKLDVNGDALIHGLTVGTGSGNISSNNATGLQALASNTTGSSNNANGVYALFSNTTGGNNTASGYLALYYNTTGSVNTATGNQALFFNTTGNFNNATGNGALFFNTTGSQNTADGNGALNSNSTGSQNTATGYAALLLNTTGSYNTAYGNSALLSNQTGSNNTALGYGADVGSGDLTNVTAIGYQALVDASNKVRIGNPDVTSIGGQVNWTTFSDGRYKRNIKEDVQGLAFINSLKPITYTVDINGLNTYMHRNSRHDAAYEKMIKEMQPAADEASRMIHSGFIAQEVEAAANKLHYNFSGVDKPKTADGLYGLRYSDFVVPLVKAVQELSKMNEDKDAKIETQDKKIAAQDKKIDALMTMVQTLQQNFQRCSPCNQQSAIKDQQLPTDHQPAISISGASLAQNIPNPFASGTTINYTLPQQYSSAKIIVTDKLGKKLKEINVSGSGKGSVKIEGSALANGTYQCSLYVNGKLIDTKQMVLQH